MNTLRLLAPLLLLAAGAIWAAPPLTTIDDMIYSANGDPFNGYAVISWRSFEASDSSLIGRNQLRVRVTNGRLRVQLVPTTTASAGAYYLVRYVSGGNMQSSEAWAVGPAAEPVRVSAVRIADPLLGPLQQPAALTEVEISDVNGLSEELERRLIKGLNFGPSAAAILNDVGELEAASGNPQDCIRVDGTSGPCGSGSGTVSAVVGTFVDGETPSGGLNGTNVFFTLTQAPNPASSLLLYRNGVLQKSGLDYTLSGATVQFMTVSTPQSGDVLLASYRTAGQGSTLPQVLCTSSGTSTASATLQSLGSCAIPAGMLASGDRVEIEASFSHSGTASAYEFQVQWGGTTAVQQTPGAGSTMAATRVSIGLDGTGEMAAHQSWGVGFALASGAVAAAENRANAIPVEFRGRVVTAGPDSVQLRNFTVVRYPAP